MIRSISVDGVIAVRQGPYVIKRNYIKRDQANLFSQEYTGVCVFVFVFFFFKLQSLFGHEQSGKF